MELIQANPNYASVKFNDGRVDTVSTKDLAPLPPNKEETEVAEVEITPPLEANEGITVQHTEIHQSMEGNIQVPRRSDRSRNKVHRLIEEM